MFQHSRGGDEILYFSSLIAFLVSFLYTTLKSGETRNKSFGEKEEVPGEIKTAQEKMYPIR
jgi:hypothetical protein